MLLSRSIQLAEICRERYSLILFDIQENKNTFAAGKNPPSLQGVSGYCVNE